ncbi:MAG TPA: hypothetical protein PLM36_25225, partial [Leptospiraceae bacterium]|nr:hypothetical protein [Leptospiraceae bacterium]
GRCCNWMLGSSAVIVFVCSEISVAGRCCNWMLVSPLSLKIQAFWGAKFRVSSKIEKLKKYLLFFEEILQSF